MVAAMDAAVEQNIGQDPRFDAYVLRACIPIDELADPKPPSPSVIQR